MGALRALACLAALMVASAGHAQTYPSGNVRIVVPYPPGGPTDLIARLCAQKLSRGARPPVLCRERQRRERRARRGDGRGRSGRMARRCCSSPMISPSRPTISQELQYDPIKSFAPIGLVSSSPSVVLVHPSVPAKTLQELIAARARRSREIQLRVHEPRPEPAHQREAFSSRVEPADRPGSLSRCGAHPGLDRRRPYARRLYRAALGDAAHQGGIAARAGGDQPEAISRSSRTSRPWPRAASTTRKPN